jgi:hypothetical protein
MKPPPLLGRPPSPPRWGRSQVHVEPLHVRSFYTGIRVLAPYKKRDPNPQLVSKLLYGVRTRLGYGKYRTCSGSTRWSLYP